MRKEINKAFGKKVYLLGMDKDAIKYWLEEPKWDCGWYWGFGYIETYTNNSSPSTSRDINSHHHANEFLGKWWYKWNNSEPILLDTTFNEKEGWELCELFEQFYFLQKAAEMFKDGKAHCTNTTIPLWKDEVKVKEINETLIPNVTKRIIEILTPSKNEEEE